MSRGIVCYLWHAMLRCKCVRLACKYQWSAQCPACWAVSPFLLLRRCDSFYVGTSTGSAGGCVLQC